MDRHKRGAWGLFIILSILLPSGGGCSCFRTGQGLILQSGWSLEFKRMPFACRGSTGEECAATIDKEPSYTCGSDVESEVLHEANPKLLERLGSSPFARLMERRGRLGLCAGCGRMARFKEPVVEEETPSVMAKFHPVPAQPVFSPRMETMHPASYAPAPIEKKRESSAPSKKSQSKAPMPEVIPPPPPVFDPDRSAMVVPRQLDVPREPSSWIFSPPPETKSAPLVEAKLPPPPSERGARR